MVLEPTVMLAWIVCFRPDGSIKRHVSSSTEAETICSLGCVRGKAVSRLRISTLSTLRQAIAEQYNCFFSDVIY